MASRVRAMASGSLAAAIALVVIGVGLHLLRESRGVGPSRDERSTSAASQEIGPPTHAAEPIASSSVVASSDAATNVGDPWIPPLAERRTWNANAVKIWLSNPEVDVQIQSYGFAVRVHAWTHNDYDTPMARLDNGPTLYAISLEEFNALKELARNAGEGDSLQKNR